jgi:pyruvate dehydrogenase E1 component alpha subunit
MAEKERTAHSALEAYQQVDRERWLSMYQQMLKVRRFEEQVNELYRSAKMPGLAHLYIGQEAVAVGVCENLRPDEAAGYCRGKGGSMHIADQETGNLGANAIVGGSSGIATGAALSAKMRGTDQVVVCFFGEGALGQGLLYEVMNMAALWSAPVLFVCENNLYNEYTHYSETTAGELLARPRAFGILSDKVDGQDVRQVFLASQRLIERARQGKGPAFLLCDTYRYQGHHVGDIDRSYYRSKEEEQRWRDQRDPIQLLSDWLLAKGLSDEAVFNTIDAQVVRETEEAVKFALEAPYPELNEVDLHVYA